MFIINLDIMEHIREDAKFAFGQVQKGFLVLCSIIKFNSSRISVISLISFNTCPPAVCSWSPVRWYLTKICCHLHLYGYPLKKISLATFQLQLTVRLPKQKFLLLLCLHWLKNWFSVVSTQYFVITSLTPPKSVKSFELSPLHWLDHSA